MKGKSLTRKQPVQCDHNGPIVTTGFVCPTDKQNHKLMIIRGLWRIRRCERCGDYFSRAKDLMDPGIIPTDDVVRQFSEQEGVPVAVENAA